MRVIAINGRKRSGKDTLANYLIDNYDNVSKVQFARTLKELFLKSFNKNHAQMSLTYDDIDGATYFDREELIENEVLNPEEVFMDFIYDLHEIVSGEIEFDKLDAILMASKLIKENEKFSVRMYLEFLGTEVAKVSDEDIWAKMTVLETINKDADMVVIPDMRFYSEYKELVENIYFDVITIKVERASDESISHSSDEGLPNHLMDYVIKNDGSVIDLYEKIENILKEEL